MRIDRAGMIAELEDYWYDLQRQNPDEEIGDIPAAVMYYREISDQELVWEYEEKIGPVQQIG